MDTPRREGHGESLSNRASVPRVVRLACLVAGLTLIGSTVGAGDTRGGSQPAPDTSRGRLSVEIIDDVVIVKARDVTVKDLLEEIARQSNLVVDAHDPLDELVTVEFDRLPLPEVLDRVLRGRSFVLRYFDPSSEAVNPARVHRSKLWVFPGRVGEDHAPPEDGGSGSTWEAVEGPGKFEAGDHLARLVLELEADDAKVRLEAVSELALGGGDRAAAVLAATAQFDVDPSVRVEAVYGLGEIGDETDLETLGLALMDPDLRVRKAAVDAVTDIGGGDSARTLAAALNDDDPSLREEAVYALSDIGGEAAASILQQALADEQRSIREAAEEVLAELARREQ